MLAYEAAMVQLRSIPVAVAGFHLSARQRMIATYRRRDANRGRFPHRLPAERPAFESLRAQLTFVASMAIRRMANAPTPLATCKRARVLNTIALNVWTDKHIAAACTTHDATCQHCGDAEGTVEHLIWHCHLC